MSIPPVVQAFYDRVWNAGDLEAIAELATDDFSFRGSLGPELRGAEAFMDYARSVRTALADYRCQILACVQEGDRAFARMLFGGRHAAAFRGFEPTGRPIQWAGAALFTFRGKRIASLWVLGDLDSLDELLRANAAEAG